MEGSLALTLLNWISDNVVIDSSIPETRITIIKMSNLIIGKDKYTIAKTIGHI